MARRGKEYEYQKDDRTAAIRRRRELVMKMQEIKRNFFPDEMDKEEEKKEKIQAKMEINQPGDRHEQEADEVARKVISGERMNGANSVSSDIQKKHDNEDNGTLMTKGEDGGLKGTTELQTKLEASKGGGESLDDKTKGEMESKMGADLSDVKIHTGTNAHEMAEGINAKAFTHGQDIYFKDGNYNTDSNEGKELLAHELAHTQQQKEGLSRQTEHTISERNGRSHYNSNSQVIYSTYLSKPLEIENSSMPGTLYEVDVKYWMNNVTLLKSPELPHQMEQFEVDPTIYFYKIVYLTLKSGKKVEFAMFGQFVPPMKTRFAEKITEEDIKRLDVVLNMQGSRPMLEYSIAIIGAQINNLEDIYTSEMGDESSMNDILSQKLPGFAAVQMSDENYYAEVIKLLGKDFLTVSAEGQGQIESKDFNTLEDAEKYAQSAMAEGSLIAKKNNKYIVLLYTSTELMLLTDALRKGYEGNLLGPMGIKKDQIVKVRLEGVTTSLEGLMDRYYISPDDIILDKAQGEPYLIFKTPSGYYGHRTVSSEAAANLWTTLEQLPLSIIDKLTLDQLHYGGQKEYFTALMAPGQSGKLHRLDKGFFRARDMYMKDQVLNHSYDEMDPNASPKEKYEKAKVITNAVSYNYAITAYLIAEMDRKETDPSAHKLRNAVSGKLMPSLQLGSIAFAYVSGKVYEMAAKEIEESRDFLSGLESDPQKLHTFLLGLPSSSLEYRDYAAELLIPDGSTRHAFKDIFSNVKKVLELTLGNDVDGQNILAIYNGIKDSKKQFERDAQDLMQSADKLIDAEGAAADRLRQKAYEELGFKTISGSGYPHTDKSDDVFVSPMQSQPGTTNMLEQLYINYSALRSNMETLKRYAIGAIIGACIMILSAGIGSLIAGAFGLAAGGLAELGVQALVLTFVEEGIAQASGGGQISSKNFGYGIPGLVLSFVENFVAFKVFHEISNITGSSTAITFLKRGAAFSLAFGGFGLYQHIKQTGGMPNARETKLMAIGSFLNAGILSAGMFLGRPFIQRMRAAGDKIYVERFNEKYGSFTLELSEKQSRLSEMIGGAEQKDSSLLKEYRKLLTKYIDLLKDAQKNKLKLNGVGNIKDEVNIEDEIKKAGEMKDMVEKIEFVHKTGMQEVDNSEKLFTYKKGQESEIIKKYGQDKVTFDNESGLITIDSPEGKLTAIPEGGLKGGETVRSELLSEKGSHDLREGENGVMFFEESKMPRLKTYFGEGNLEPVADGIYVGKKEINGKTVRQIFVSESLAGIVDGAIKAENFKKGSGLTVIRLRLRSGEAYVGLEKYLQEDWKGYSVKRQLEELKAMEEKAIKDGKDLSKVLEERGKGVISEIKVNEVADFLKSIKFDERPEIMELVNEAKEQLKTGKVNDQIINNLRENISIELAKLNLKEKFPENQFKYRENVEVLKRIEETSIEEWKKKNPSGDIRQLREIEGRLYKPVGEIDVLITQREGSIEKIVDLHEVKSGDESPGKARSKFEEAAFKGLKEIAKGNSNFILIDDNSKSITDLIDKKSISMSKFSSTGPSSSKSGWTYKLELSTSELNNVAKQIIQNKPGK